jgi:LysM domain
MIARSRNHARCLLIWASLTALLVLAQVLAVDALLTASAALQHDGLAAQRFDQLLVGLCSALVIGCGAWWWLVSSLVVLDAARGACGSPPRGCPAILRRWLLVACGMAVASTVATTGAYAAPAIDPSRGHPAAEAEPRLPGVSQRRVIAGLPLPDRVGVGDVTPSRWPMGGGRRLPMPANSRPDTSEPFVVVRPGESLWAIAADALGHDARAATIDSFWRDLYNLNRHVIGPDPDLIHPGLTLRLPGARQE